MAPQAETQTLTPSPPPAKMSLNEEEKEIKREEIFARFDNPLGLPQHQYNLLRFSIEHVFTIYVFYLMICGTLPWNLLIIELFFGYMGGLGITVGCHRLWTHKTFKATLPLQCLLMIMQTVSNQHSIYRWSLEHRIHHKYTDTDADPHNSKRGFLFSHFGWMVLPKREEFKRKLKTFDMSDLESDPLIRFQCKWFWTLILIFHFAIPISLTYYIYELPLFYCFASNCHRQTVALHFTFFVNSLAHIWGDKPYDKSISATDNAFVSLVTVGEGWHNYHHTFPWDYKASEFGWKINASTMLIDFFASIGWAYDLKTVSQKMLRERRLRTGDGAQSETKSASAMVQGNEKDFDYKLTSSPVTELTNLVDQHIWGWGDETLTHELRDVTKILHSSRS